MVRTRAGLFLLAVMLTGCSLPDTPTSSSTSDSSPAPAPAPAPTPSIIPAPAPASPPPLAVTVDPAAIASQRTARGTVTLAEAPSTAAEVVLSSDDPTVASVPGSVTIAANTTTATFALQTSTAPQPTQVTITATYAGLTGRVRVTVNPPDLVPAFTVTSRSRGTNICVLIEGGTQLDCTFDGRASAGFIERWIWTYSVGRQSLGHITRDGLTEPANITCDFFEDAAAKRTDSNGNGYFPMEVTLELQERSGRVSEPLERAVRLYPDSKCGFSY